MCLWDTWGNEPQRESVHVLCRTLPVWPGLLGLLAEVTTYLHTYLKRVATANSVSSSANSTEEGGSSLTNL